MDPLHRRGSDRNSLSVAVLIDHHHNVTERIAINSANPDPAAIKRAAAILRAGGLVAFPTETVYGLGADATNPAAVRRIFEAKERDLNDPLIVHIAEREALAEVAGEIPAMARLLADAFWPGGLTLVLPRGAAVASEVSAGGPTVAVRLPSHAVARALIAAAGRPIAAPSANRFTRTSATTAEHVFEDLDGRFDLLLDGGPAEAGVESTVVAFEPGVLRVLRPGAVSNEALARVVEAAGGRLVVGAAPRLAGTLASPGLLAKHYAPRAPFVYVTGHGEAARAALLFEIGAAGGLRVGLLLQSEERRALGEALVGAVVEDLGPEGDSGIAAHRLFAAMRALDAAAVGLILARQLPLDGLGAAIHDRLTRAATRIVATP